MQARGNWPCLFSHTLLSDLQNLPLPPGDFWEGGLVKGALAPVSKGGGFGPWAWSLITRGHTGPAVGVRLLFSQGNGELMIKQTSSYPMFCSKYLFCIVIFYSRGFLSVIAYKNN